MTENYPEQDADGVDANTAEPAGPDDDAVELAHRLFDAARAGETELLQNYVRAGAPVGMTNAAGDSLLMLAAYNGHADTVSALLAGGAEPESLNDRGQSPLAGAVFKGYTDVVRVLIEAGADPKAGTPSALAAAQMFERTEMLPLLEG